MAESFSPTSLFGASADVPHYSLMSNDFPCQPNGSTAANSMLSKKPVIQRSDAVKTKFQRWSTDDDRRLTEAVALHSTPTSATNHNPLPAQPDLPPFLNPSFNSGVLPSLPIDAMAASSFGVELEMQAQDQTSADQLSASSSASSSASPIPTPIPMMNPPNPDSDPTPDSNPNSNPTPQAESQLGGIVNWDLVSLSLTSRTASQCQQRYAKIWQPLDADGAPGYQTWTPSEDTTLKRLVLERGAKKWSKIAVELPGRSGKQCRERWHNQVDPAISTEDWSEEEVSERASDQVREMGKNQILN